MTLPLLVTNQAYVFICSVIGGMLMAFIYDLFRIKRKALKTGSILTYIEDILYWIIVALVMFVVVYISNEGEIRGFVVLGTLLGVVLYILLLSKIIINSSLFIIKIITALLKKIWIVITWPIHLILKILDVPGRFLFKLSRKTVKKAGRAGKNRITSMKRWARVLRNRKRKL